MKPLSFVLLLSLCLPIVSTANDDITENWVCSSCPARYGWDLNLDLGPAFVSDDAYRFGNITGLDSSSTYAFADIYARYRDADADYFIADGYLRGGSSQGLFLRTGRQSRYEFSAVYQNIPRRLHGATATPYTGTSDLRLPDEWVRASTTQGMSALPASLTPTPIGSDIERLGLGVEYRFTSAWDVQVAFDRRQQQGRDRFGGGFLFNAIELAAPADRVTSNLDASIGFRQETWQARLSYFGSTFENDVQRLDWDNAYSVPFGVSRGSASLAPDNEAHRVALSGSLRLPAKTTVNASASVGRMKQNATLLPYTSNPSIPAQGLPVESANAEVETSNVNLRATSSAWRKLTLEAQYRANRHDNKTAMNQFDYVITDTTLAGVPAMNRAYDYDRSEWRLRANYRVWRPTTLTASISSKRMDRSGQERSRTETDAAQAGIRIRGRGIALLNVDAFWESRDGTEYGQVDNPAAPQNPLLRKYNMADRDRNGLRAQLSFLSIPNTEFAFEFELLTAEYENSTIGLTDTESRRFGVDFAYVFNPLANTYLSLSNESTRSNQQNSQSFSTPDWAATNRDRFSMALLGYQHRELFDRFDLVFEYSVDRSTGKIENNTSGLMTSFPDLKGRRDMARIGIEYPWSDSLRFGIDYLFEQVDNDDWGLDGVAPDTVPTLLSLGASAWNYTNNVIYLSVHYQRRSE